MAQTEIRIIMRAAKPDTMQSSYSSRDARMRRACRAGLVVVLSVGLVCVACSAPSRDTETTKNGDEASAEAFEESLAAVLSIGEDFARADQLIALLLAAGPRDRATLEETVRERYRAIDPLDRLLLLKAWAKQDPEAATSWARATAPTNIREAATTSATREWALQDPEAAVRALPVDDVGIGRAVVSGWFDSGKPGLAEFVLSQGAGKDGQLLISAYVRKLIAQEGSGAARAWAESAEGDEKLLVAVYRHTGKEIATIDPDAAIAFCDAHCGEAYGDSLFTFVARRVGQIGEGPKALTWIAKFENADPKERRQGARFAFREWMISDRAAAVDWAGAFVEENGHVDWFEPIPGLVVASLAWKKPLEALKWADWISDREQKELALITIARRWRRNDAEAAEKWLASSPLSVEARQRSRENPARFSGTGARAAPTNAGSE